MLYENFKNGINIGGWLSQYDCILSQPFSADDLEHHFQTFIQEKDLKQIAFWKYDHVRLPVNGYLLYNPDTDTLNPDITARIHTCIQWCKKYHLNVILDLHDLWGNVYGAMEQPMPLLTDSTLQHRFLRIWNLLTAEFKNIKQPVLLFELLNEVSDASGAYAMDDVTGKSFDLTHKEDFLWNTLAQKAVQEIRSIDPQRWILIGSNGQNSIVYLKELQVFDDPYVFYNFHYYEPQVFTHQRAHFSAEMKEFDRSISYPDDISSFTEYLKSHPAYYTKHALVAKERRNDQALMKKLLQYAIDFMETSNKEVYCGEYGVIDTASAEDADNWIHDLTSIMDQYHIGHARWNYKCLDFGLIGLEN